MSAVLHISPELLLDVLCLPPNTKILAANVGYGIGGSGVLILIVDHPDLPTGQQYVSAAISADFRDPKEGEKIKEVKFDGWV